MAFHLYQHPQSKPLCMSHSDYLPSEAPRRKQRSRGLRSTMGRQIICSCSFSSNWKATRGMSNIHPGRTGASWNKFTFRRSTLASLNTVPVLQLKMESGCGDFDRRVGDKWEGRVHDESQAKLRLSAALALVIVVWARWIHVGGVRQMTCQTKDWAKSVKKQNIYGDLRDPSPLSVTRSAC